MSTIWTGAIRYRTRTWRILAATSPLLLGIAWAVLTQVQQEARASALQRAQHHAADLAQQFDWAVSLAIPLDRLPGIGAVMTQRIHAAPEIASLRLVDTRTKTVIAEAKRPAPPPSILDALPRHAAVEVATALHTEQSQRYALIVRLTPGPPPAFYLKALLLFICLTLASVVSVSEMMCYAERRFPPMRWTPVTRCRGAFVTLAGGAPARHARAAAHRLAAAMLGATLGVQTLLTVWATPDTVVAFAAGTLAAALLCMALTSLAASAARLAGLCCLALGSATLTLSAQSTASVLGAALSGIGAGTFVCWIRTINAPRSDAHDQTTCGAAVGALNGILLVAPFWGTVLHSVASPRWRTAWLTLPLVGAACFCAGPRAGRHAAAGLTGPVTGACIRAAPLVTALSLGFCAGSQLSTSPTAISAGLDWQSLTTVIALSASAWVALRCPSRLLRGKCAMIAVAGVALLSMDEDLLLGELSLCAKAYLFGQACRVSLNATHRVPAVGLSVTFALAVACAALAYYCARWLAIVYALPADALCVLSAPLLLAVWASGWFGGVRHD